MICKKTDNLTDKHLQNRVSHNSLVQTIGFPEEIM